MLNYPREAGEAGKAGNSNTVTLWWRRQPLWRQHFTSVSKSYCRQTARVAEDFPDRRWE